MPWQPSAPDVSWSRCFAVTCRMVPCAHYRFTPDVQEFSSSSATCTASHRQTTRSSLQFCRELDRVILQMCARNPARKPCEGLGPDGAGPRQDPGQKPADRPSLPEKDEFPVPFGDEARSPRSARRSGSPVPKASLSRRDPFAEGTPSARDGKRGRRVSGRMEPSLNLNSSLLWEHWEQKCHLKKQVAFSSQVPGTGYTLEGRNFGKSTNPAQFDQANPVGGHGCRGVMRSFAFPAKQ
jgi:hypothetical protein